MGTEEQIICGGVGTVLGVAGTATSITEIQAIISIIVTIAAFIISVFIPTVIKIVQKIKEAKSDGIISKEERDSIMDDINGLIDKTQDEAEKIVKQPKNKDK